MVHLHEHMLDDDEHMYDEDNGEYEEEYEEVEEVVDNLPMHIANRIYLGSIDAANNASGLEAKNIRMVLSLLSDYDTLQLPLDYLVHVRVAVEDDFDEPLFGKLPYLVECIHNFLTTEPDGNILVHCIAGVSRSASAVIAYLMATESIDFDAALDHVRMSRPWVDPNEHFRAHLRLFHDILTNVENPDLLGTLEQLALPRLHFHASFVAPITTHGPTTKTLTIRLDSDKIHDPNSDLASIYRFSTIAAITDKAASPFAYLHVTHVEACTVDELTPDHAAAEGLASVGDLWRTLHQFYPAITGASPIVTIHFRLLVATSIPTSS
ncbi:Aste57867_9264 [Aphanomyces stellatus]|uniref:Aste57867_9264 protein n=1 Tax=Aphanomyces stellatus TaxID=120398 RepID=A0A485KMF2_9STRA|nr:hypothetical protein As57867_009228 [Aphanomyces stellatus]VFT86147.1 Aste57867_9264 [Aphanomyces stellatus]